MSGSTRAGPPEANYNGRPDPGGLRELLFKGHDAIVGRIDPSPNNTPEGNAKYKQ